jgi:ArsR family transcriptional regulator
LNDTTELRPGELLRGLRALASPTRLDVCQLLLRVHPAGLCVLELTDRMDVRYAPLSNHLAVLNRAGLIHGERAGRCIHYFVRPERLARLTQALLGHHGKGTAVAPVCDDCASSHAVASSAQRHAA